MFETACTGTCTGRMKADVNKCPAEMMYGIRVLPGDTSRDAGVNSYSLMIKSPEMAVETRCEQALTGSSEVHNQAQRFNKCI